MEMAVRDIERVLHRVKAKQLKAMEEAILRSDRVFVTGLGRTGLMARGFAMRLMHLGREVYHVGDVITPRIQKRDLLIICSRTGRSKVLGHYVRIARKVKARVVVVTAREGSPAAEKADVVLGIDDKMPKRGNGEVRPPPPLGSLFEQALLIVLDQVVIDLMQALDFTEADMERIHTGFE
jgi:6-phospho-3-hexuloisomerase